MFSGWHRECGAVRPLRGGLLHLPLASRPRRRAVWTQGLVQHRGGPFSAGPRDGRWDTGVPLCHSAGLLNERIIVGGSGGSHLCASL